MCTPGVRLPQRKVNDFWENGRWNEMLLRSAFQRVGVPLETAADISKIPIDSSAETVLNRTTQYLQQLITAGKLGKEQWSGCEGVSMFNITSWKEKPRKQIKLIRWIPPDTSWLKLNVDGVWNNEGAGAGGILRDEDGNLICGYKSYIMANSRKDAILQALCLGLNMAVGRGRHIWIEIGDQGTAETLLARKYGAAELRHRTTEVRNALKRLNVKITHTPREGNKIANQLAQQGGKLTQFELIDQHSASHLIKSMVRMEQLGLPNFQFRR
ncbi:hypothetical protein SASPL_100483 [Salvia splendens]|uniref:RNase H type-1 domain-containing protein n=1 Tax=Salvia splendens TaxID=180675 RepID=A0A8X8YQ42_SALSN|nr:hypothetical protein SASPL_100483 [Salvia splendens]